MLAANDFMMRRDADSLKTFLQVMHSTNSQHTWYKNYRTKLAHGVAAGQWLWGFLQMSCTDRNYLAKMFQQFEVLIVKRDGGGRGEAAHKKNKK